MNNEGLTLRVLYAIGYLSLIIGTEKKGKLKKGAGLYFGFIKTGEKETVIRKLRELKKLKTSISNHSS